MTSQVEVPPLTGLIHFISGKRRVKVKVTDFEILQIKYYVKVFKELILSKPNDGCDSDFA